MSYKKKQRERLAFRSANVAWITAELKKLFAEWVEWAEYVKTIEDHEYDRNTHAECFADGVENLKRHRILREKTLVFLDNNIQGHDFMLSNQYEEPFESNISRLRNIVPHRLEELEVLSASLEYAAVPDGFWKEQGKKMVEELGKAAPEKATDIAASWLRNPFSPK